MKKKLPKLLLRMMFFVFLGVLVLYLSGNIGVFRGNIEKDARDSQHIDEGWQVSKALTDDTAALIFYDEDHKNHTFSIYTKRSGISFGYFFRSGGHLPLTEGTIYVEAQDRERVCLSMNEESICRAEIDDGNGIKTIEIDSEKPFALIFEKGAGVVTLYDKEGNIIAQI